MHYDFIEIGTSDFRTLLETNSGKGLSIEPIKMYLDNLPDKENVTKVNVGISDTIGEVKIYYVKPEDILTHKLPNWVRGCNTINEPHPSILELLGDKHDDIITIDTVSIINWFELIKRYDITSIDLLKIDTEGHDSIILNDYLDNCEKNIKLLANKIIFENNVLSDKNTIAKTIKRFNNLGYSGEQVGYDYMLLKK